MTKIEIDLADLGVRYDEEYGADKVTITDLIIEAAARMLIANDAELKQAVRTKVGQIVDEQTTALVGDMVADALAAPIQRRAPWGDKVGEETTVREIIREKVEAFFQAPSGRRDSFSSSSTPRNLTDLIEAEVGRTLTADMKTAVVDAKKQIKDTVTQRALEAAVKELAR